jgi:hypothetical protein
LSGQLHTPAALLPEKVQLALIGWAGGQVPKVILDEVVYLAEVINFKIS